MLALAAGNLDETGFAAWIRRHSRLTPSNRSRRPSARTRPP
jgi:hypothetical protein